MKPTLQALLFDVDGTLANTEADGHRVAFNLAFEEYGLDWRWDVELYGRLLAVTGGKERMRYYAETVLEGKNLPDDLQALIPELHRAKTRHYTALLANGGIPLRTGVEALLRAARERSLRLAIATTTTPENVTALLTHTLGADAIDWFEVIAAGDIVPAKKPAPDIYHYALERMRLPADACLAFEDSHNGLRAALDAGLRTVVTTNDYTTGHDFDGAAIVLDQMGDEQTPFRVCQGDAGGFRHLDIDMLEYLHRQQPD